MYGPVDRRVELVAVIPKRLVNRASDGLIFAGRSTIMFQNNERKRMKKMVSRG